MSEYDGIYRGHQPAGVPPKPFDARILAELRLREAADEIAALRVRRQRADAVDRAFEFFMGCLAVSLLIWAAFSIYTEARVEELRNWQIEQQQERHQQVCDGQGRC